MIRIPWRAWYGDEELELRFPPSWHVRAYWPADGPDIGQGGIEAAFENPIGTPTIEALARGKRRVSIAVDDISRPAPAARLMSSLMRRLQKAGVDLDQVRVVLGTGMHRPMVKEDIVKKIGPAAADRLDVHNNHPYDNVVDLGTSARGIPVRICRFFAEADLKIGVGSITPHGGPGFGGGAKVVIPGVASFETVATMHKPGWLQTGLNDVEHNELRAEIEHMVRDRVRLDCIANVVVNSRRQVAGLFVGDMIAAHRAGVQFARQVYATGMPAEAVDVAICNAYPKDTDFLQNGMARNVLASSPRPVVKEGGTIVIVTASPEGRGYHALYGPGMCYDPLREPGNGGNGASTPNRSAADSFAGTSTVYFSPNLSAADTRSNALFRRWEDLIQYLEAQHGDGATAAVFPCASIQLAGERAG
jgi:nickel-dependent lactate racemase